MSNNRKLPQHDQTETTSPCAIYKQLLANPPVTTKKKCTKQFNIELYSTTEVMLTKNVCTEIKVINNKMLKKAQQICEENLATDSSPAFRKR